VAKDVAEGAFTNLSAALKNHFDSRNGQRTGAKVGFPRFKSRKDRRQSFHLNNDKFRVRGHSLYVPKLGWVNMAETLRFAGKIMGAVVSREVGRWYVSIAVEMNQPESFQFPRASAGLDLGLKSLVVLSDGTQYENQVLLRTELTHLKQLSRRLSRRQKDSTRWWRAKHQLARFHERIADRRADHLHKLTTELASTYAVLGWKTCMCPGCSGIIAWPCPLQMRPSARSGVNCNTRATGLAAGWCGSTGSIHPANCAQCVGLKILD